MIGSSVIGAQLAFMKALADIGKRDGVQVNRINPGSVDTDRFRHRLGIIMKRTGLDEAAAIEHHRKELNITRFGRPEDMAAWWRSSSRRAGAGCTARPSTWTAARSSRCACRSTIESKRALEGAPFGFLLASIQFERALRVLDRRLVIPAAAPGRLDGLRRTRFRSRRLVSSDAGGERPRAGNW